MAKSTLHILEWQIFSENSAACPNKNVVHKIHLQKKLLLAYFKSDSNVRDARHRTKWTEKKINSLFFSVEFANVVTMHYSVANFTKALIQKYKWISIDSYRNRLALNRRRSIFVRMNWKEFHNVQSYRNHIVIHESSSTYMIVGSLFQSWLSSFFLAQMKKKRRKIMMKKTQKNTRKNVFKCTRIFQIEQLLLLLFFAFASFFSVWNEILIFLPCQRPHFIVKQNEKAKKRAEFKILLCSYGVLLATCNSASWKWIKWEGIMFTKWN